MDNYEAAEELKSLKELVAELRFAVEQGDTGYKNLVVGFYKWSGAYEKALDVAIRELTNEDQNGIRL